jgi:hypothetical protein
MTKFILGGAQWVGAHGQWVAIVKSIGTKHEVSVDFTIICNNILQLFFTFST